MPLDFAAIAALFQERVQLETRLIAMAQEGISGPLGKRLSAARSVDAATRQFPIVRFYNGAPVMKITASQLGSLALVTPPPSVIQGIVRGSLGFARGFAQIWAPFKGNSQETVLLRFSRGIDDALSEIEASLKRFEKPRPEMFDPRNARGSDIFGLAALAFRALDEASRRGGDLDNLSSQIVSTLLILGPEQPSAAGNGGGQAPTEGGPSPSIGEKLDFAAYSLLGGILTFALMPGLIDLLLEGVVIRVKTWLLDEFSGIERSVMDLRASIIRGTFNGIIDWTNSAIDLLGGIHEVLGANIAFMLKFWREFGTEFAASIRDFVIKLVDYFQGWITLVRALPDILQAVTSFDLTLLLRNKLGGVVDYVPSLSLDELLDSSGERLNLTKYEEWMTLLDAGEAALLAGPPLITGAIGTFLLRNKIKYGLRQVSRMRRLMNALFPGAAWNPLLLGTIRTIPRAKFLAEAPPLDFKAEFPNLYETLMGGGRVAELNAIIDNLQHSVDYGLTETIRRGRDGLSELSTVFDKASKSAAAYRPDKRFEGVADSATTMAEQVFGPEVTREREAAASRKPDKVALAFEHWLADAGFQLIGQVMPVYIREMASYWRQQVEQSEELTAPVTPTSPRILRQRAVLGKVVLPRLTLRAPPRTELDQPLLESMRDNFVTAVERAYTLGQTRLADMAGAP